LVAQFHVVGRVIQNRGGGSDRVPSPNSSAPLPEVKQAVGPLLHSKVECCLYLNPVATAPGLNLCLAARVE